MSAGNLRATIVPELGGGLADFSLVGPAKFAYPLMRRAAPAEKNPSSLASFFMAPWCNRVAGAAFEFRGKQHRLRPNAPTPGAPAQHGDVRARPFEVHAHTPDSVTLELNSRAFPDMNWPWPFVCRAAYTLRPEALRVDLSVTNVSDEPFPAGCGHHPYFPRRLWHDADEVQICAAVTGRYALNEGVAAGAAARDPLTERLREPRPAPAEHVDTVFAGFDGAKGATIHWPASGVRLRVTASANMGHLVLYCPHADAGKPGGVGTPLPWIAVEPQTQVNGALSAPQPGDGTVILAPGETLATWTEFGVS